VATAAEFTDTDWTIAADTKGFLSSSKSIAPRTRIRLASLLAENKYMFLSAEKTAEQILRRIERVYSTFEWNPVPLSDTDAELALRLDYEDGVLLKQAPKDGAFSIPRLLAKTATSALTLDRLDASCAKLANFGIRGPAPSETYLGVSWSAALSEAKEERIQPNEH
jgi:hypothetical protein